MAQFNSSQFNETLFNGSAVGLDVLTLDASEISDVSAFLNGELLQLDEEKVQEVEVWFRYREEGDVDWLETDSELLTEPSVFDSFVDGLFDGTTYEFEAFALQEDLEARGGVRSFTTTFVKQLLFRLEEVRSDFSDVFVLNRFFDVVGDAVSVFDRGVEWVRGFNSVSDGFKSLFDGFLIFLRSFSVRSDVFKSLVDWDFVGKVFVVVSDSFESVFNQFFELFRSAKIKSKSVLSGFDRFFELFRGFGVGSGLVRSVFDRSVEWVRGFINKMDEVRISWERIFTQLTRIRDKTLKVVKEKVKQIGGSIK